MVKEILCIRKEPVIFYPAVSAIFFLLFFSFEKCYTMPKVPEVKRCCCCCPLRPGIIVFGIINITFSLVAASVLVVTTELKRSHFMNDTALEVVTSTVLFSIFGMSVILNILLLVAGYQKDISMLRLYNYYAVATTLIALVPTIILLSRLMLYDVAVALFAIVMQCYVIVLVRSEVVKLELQLMTADEEQPPPVSDEAVDVADQLTLL